MTLADCRLRTRNQVFHVRLAQTGPKADCLRAVRCIRPTSSLVGDGCRSGDPETTCLPGVLVPFDALAGRLVPAVVPNPRRFFRPRRPRCRCCLRRKSAARPGFADFLADPVPLRAIACPACPVCSNPAASLGFFPTEFDRPRAGATFLDVAVVSAPCPSVPWPSHITGFASESDHAVGFRAHCARVCQDRGVCTRRPVTRSNTCSSTSRFAGGSASSRPCALAGSTPVDLQSTSAWVSSGCLCRPGWCRSVSWRAVLLARRSALVREPCGPRLRFLSLLSFTVAADLPCGISSAPAPSTSLSCRHIAVSPKQAGIQGFQLRPSASLRLLAVRGQRISSRRRSSRAQSDAPLLGVLAYPPGFDRATLQRISPPLPSRSCRTARAVAGASRYLSVTLR